MRSYDDHQIEAVLVTWLCCRRTVYATNPQAGCLSCQKALQVILDKLTRGEVSIATARAAYMEWSRCR